MAEIWVLWVECLGDVEVVGESTLYVSYSACSDLGASSGCRAAQGVWFRLLIGCPGSSSLSLVLMLA